jgi:hypothetical protein
MVCTYSPPYTAHLEKPGTTHAHKEYDNSLEGPPLLVSANTVPRFLTGGAGAKPLLGLENTVRG